MEILELMKKRHSVRQYTDRIIEEEKREELNRLIASINGETGLHIQIFYEEPGCFQGARAHYGKFRNVTNYICLVGKKRKDLEEICGYFGEMLVLKAQELGLNSCWVALTHGKSQAQICEKEKEVCIIALGYGENQGNPHKNKNLNQICQVLTGDKIAVNSMEELQKKTPEWFSKGVEAALLAPTAVNQQKFQIIYDGYSAKFKAGFGMYSNLDLGIVEYHFEAAADDINK